MTPVKIKGYRAGLGLRGNGEVEGEVFAIEVVHLVDVDARVGGGDFAGMKLGIVCPDQELHGVVLHAGPPVGGVDLGLCSATEYSDG
jgi:hypothetical protein